MKWLIVAIIVITIGIGGFYAFNNYIYQQKQGETINPVPTQTMEDSTTFNITPISHATMVITIAGQTIYTDPVGGKELFSKSEPPTLILITDIHGDHMDPDTLKAISTFQTNIVVPQAVADKLPKDIPGKIVVMKNGETNTQNGIALTAVPMYNLPEAADTMHTKGRGNGYVLEAASKRIYIAGDTDAIPEMKALQNIDVAFVPMNPPYTMSVEEAADGVVAFKPKVVHPYHYRTPNGLSDVNKFKELVVAKDPNVKVDLLDFYANK